MGQRRLGPGLHGGGAAGSRDSGGDRGRGAGRLRLAAARPVAVRRAGPREGRGEAGDPGAAGRAGTETGVMELREVPVRDAPEPARGRLGTADRGSPGIAPRQKQDAPGPASCAHSRLPGLDVYQTVQESPKQPVSRVPERCRGQLFPRLKKSICD